MPFSTPPLPTLVAYVAPEVRLVPSSPFLPPGIRPCRKLPPRKISENVVVDVVVVVVDVVVVVVVAAASAAGVVVAVAVVV